jgi:hypothetical protein
LKIFQEFNDRFGQAITYYQLGLVAREEKDYASSLGYFATAVEIFLERNEQINLQIALIYLVGLLQIKDWDAAAAIEHLEIKEETKKVLLKILEHAEKKKS